jgi:hypothetical protein
MTFIPAAPSSLDADTAIHMPTKTSAAITTITPINAT